MTLPASGGTTTAVAGTASTVVGYRAFTRGLNVVDGTILATLAEAAAQPVLKYLHRLLLDGDRLYASYGDYINNTGPTVIASLDVANPGDGFVTELTAATEQTWSMTLTDDGRLFVPYLDATGYADPAVAGYAVRSAAGAWSTVTSVDPTPVHAYRICETADGLFLAGAGNTAEPDVAVVVWRSTDDGATWAPDLTADDSDGGTRCYDIVELNGTLVAFVRVGAETVAYTRPAGSGSAWSTVIVGNPSTVSDAQAFTRNGTQVALCVRSGKSSGRPIVGPIDVAALPADATTRTATAAALVGVEGSDIAVTPDGASAYIVGGMTVWRLGASGPAVQLHDLAVPAYSIAVSGECAYFGDADGSVRSISLTDLEL